MSSFKIFLKTFVISSWCLVVFIGLGYYYIDSQNIKVENEVESVPYYQQAPDNKGLLFKFGTRSVYIFLDFEASSVKVMLNPDDVTQKGYSVDYTLEGYYTLVADMCDYFDGINLTLNAETLRYTGGQVVELLAQDNSDMLRRQIISAIFEKLARQGIGIDFLNMLITDSKTNLKMPDCYFWAEYLDDISKNIDFLSK